jgi:drug/metabolite transporter (DMT)-like permease
MSPWLALLALGAVTLIWGGSFTWMKQSLDSAKSVLGEGRELHGTALFLLLRFGAASLLMLAIPRARAVLDPGVARGGLILGGLLFGGFVLQMAGLSEVSPAVSAFLTSLYVLFTALIVTFQQKKRLSWVLIVGAICSTAGAAFIRGAPQMLLSFGELMTIACALLFGIHILATDHVSRRVDALAVSTSSFLVVTLGCAGWLLWFQMFRTPLSGAEFTALLQHRDFLLPLLLMTVFGTAVALTFMNLFQKQVDPVRAAILYSTEPVWAAAFGVWMGYDQLSGWLFFGGGLLLGGNLFVELGPRWLGRR